MKKLVLEDENEGWFEILLPTHEQANILHDEATSNEVRRSIIDSLYQPASDKDATSAQALYSAHKIEGADLIACDVMLPQGNGIINCRLNNEHKQIRF